MFNFFKFKTSFNVYDEKKKRKEEVSYGTSVTGVYRTHRNESFVNRNYSESQGKVRPAPSAPQPVQLRQTKSTSDLIKNENLPQTIRQAQSGVSLDPRGTSENKRNSRVTTSDATNSSRQLDAHKRVEKQRLEEQKKLEKQRLEEEKRLEKQRLEEQKKSQKVALQEQTKQDKLRKEREKQEAQESKIFKKVKRPAPQRPLANPLAQSTSLPVNNLANESTNTLNSSISKTSGPPPYSEVPSQESMENQNNVQFSKPVDTGSWDMIAQHRNNVIANRPVTTTQPQKPIKGQTTLDLNYSLGENKSDV